MKLLHGLRSYRNIFGLSLVMALFLMAALDSYSAFIRPVLPRLSLTGAVDSYDRDFYPDGRIWVPPSATGAREFLMPVFITNNWYTYKNQLGVALYTVDPIRSFSFSVFYNEKAVRFVGVETVNSIYNELDYQPLAQQFFIDAEDKKDDYYWYYISPTKWFDTKDNLDGRRVTFDAVSMGQALPNTDLDNEEFKVLFYVRFRIVANKNDAGTDFGLIQNTPIYIDNRSVKYNDMDVAKDNTWKGFTDYDVASSNYQKLYSRPIIGNNRNRLDSKLFLPETYLDGMNNAPTSEDENAIILPGPLSDPNKFNEEPVYPGVITLKITDNIPKIRVATITDDVFDSIGVGSLFAMPQIIAVDDNSPDQRGIARFKVSNSTSKSRLLNVWFETDSPWLTLRKDDLNKNTTLTLNGSGRYGYAQYIDNAILGEDLDPMVQPTQDDGDVFLRIEANPALLPPINNDEPHGLHVGYITIKSDFAEISPIRVKVLFLYMKNPYEPDWTKSQGNPGGINLNLRNSAGAGGDNLKLIFGTGSRATDGVDLLYGEGTYNGPLSGTNFDARFFPVDTNLEKTIPFGFSDIAPNPDNPRTKSRDIRSYDLAPGQNSHIYHVKFYNPENAYPISVEWNLSDFPDGAQLFIRQVLNGQTLQATDMRNATFIDQNRRGITITDRNIHDFYIEYTLPQTINFVDENGDPIIKRGWNLLSLPLAPTNTKWDVVYKNAINVPWAFVNSQYQDREYLRVGEGYFVKYSSVVDQNFAGAFINEINKDNGIRVWAGDIADATHSGIFGGWNLVGALSVVTGTDGIKFYPLPNQNAPSVSYTKEYGVYGYRTDKGYFEVSNLFPGLGYWIKVAGDGYYGLQATYPIPKVNMTESSVSKQDIIKRSAKLTLNDNGQHSKDIFFSNDKTVATSVFEFPPVFSSDMFDVRFTNNAYLTNEDVNVMNVQGVKYPVSLSLNYADADYTFTDAVTNENYGTIKAGTNGSIKIDEIGSGKIKVMKQTAVDQQFSFMAYPTPANDFTTVRFSLPQSELVTVKLFDAIGNEVAQFISEFRMKGDYTETLSLKNVQTGNYLLKISAGVNSSVIKINVIR